MKAWMKTALVLLPLTLWITQCTKNPVDSQTTQPATETQETQATSPLDPEVAVQELDAEIAQLEEAVLSDSTNDIPERVERALRRLDRFLDRVHPIVEGSDNETAKTLYREAREAQERAVRAAREERYGMALAFILESRHLAVDALRLINGEEIEEEIYEHLVAKMEELRGVLNHIQDLLAQQENENAQKLYRLAEAHYTLAAEVLYHRALRRAGFHIRKAFQYANRALEILEPSE